ncbi:MAG: phospho-N-acetylmuramoyl-pentapeptide-transferase [Oscillospiraceae bacterium]|jgi:phospho-N-acetylmuramoyl-pentapeptide-transferase|nr:phospho-N-acetylmuramoyl-pentapeptide-transferase [Oscillospiraceae bacterium]
MNTSGILTVCAAVLSFAITAALGRVIIPMLQRLKFGQTIKEIGPKWHESKQGTPTMGGIMFVIGIILTVAVLIPSYFGVSSSVNSAILSNESPLYRTRLWAGIFLGISYGAIGFLDDYIKIVKKRNLGLTSMQKIILQIAVAAGYLVALIISGQGGDTEIPFIGHVNLGVWFYPLALFIIVGFVNAVNLTDGVDGLATSVTFFAAVTFIFIASLRLMFGMSIVAAAVAGGCLGFLVWNFFPAKVFMGDTGSLFLGGLFCALAFGINMPILIIPVGIIYLCEAGSVMLQVAYFKLTHGKRIFKMSPIHHHFEMSGWSEIKIVTVFSAITILAGVISVLCVIYGGILL